MSGFVYKWIDTSNDMYYIGSHKGFPDDGYTGSGKFFKRAYSKRKDFFKRKIIYIGEHFRELEEFILEELDSKNDKQSYNLKNCAIGGPTRTGMKNSLSHRKKLSKANKGKKLKKETKDKLRLVNLGKKHSADTIAKMSESRSGNKNHFYGKSHSANSIKKMSESKKGFYIGDDKMQKIWDNNKIIVYCNYLDKEFNSIKECAEALGISQPTASNMIAGRSKNKYGIKKC